MVHREIPREIEPEALTPLEVEAITRAVFVGGDPQPCELMLVFGASRASGNWRPAASLMRSGFAKRVLVTGGMPYCEDEALPEAVGIRGDLIELGVRSGSIIVEERSRNTLENVTLSLELLLGAGAMPASICSIASRTIPVVCGERSPSAFRTSRCLTLVTMPPTPA